MSEKCFLTVILLTTKRPKFFDQCLRSLMAQERLADQISVVMRSDDQKGIEVLQKYLTHSRTKINYLFFDQIGITKAMNHGLKGIEDGMVCFIDDDAIAEKHWLENIEKHFCNHEIGAVGGLCLLANTFPQIISSGNNLLTVSKWGMVSNYGAEFSPEKPVFVDHLQGTNMAMRRKLIDKFDEDLLGHCFRQEMDMCLKIKKKGYRLAFDPKIIVYHFLAPCLDTDRQAVDKKIYETHANNTYVLLKHLNNFHKFGFLFLTFLWGDGAAPGLGKYVLRAIRYKDLSQISRYLPWALKGKCAGIKLYCRNQFFMNLNKFRSIKPTNYFFISSSLPKTGGEKTNLCFVEKLIEEKENVQIVPLGDIYRRYYRGKIKNVFLYYLVRLGLMIDIFFHNLGKKGIIVYDYYYSGILTLYLIVEKYLFNSPIVGIVYHFDCYRSENKNTYPWWRLFWEKLPLLISNKIVTDSQFCFREISSLGIDERKITVISPGLDKNSKPVICDFAVKKNNSDFQLLFVGHLSPRKGAIYLLMAMKKIVVRYSVCLNLVGNKESDGQYYQKVDNFIQENNLRDSIRIHGWVKDDLLMQFYSQADIFVLPSLCEGFGIVLLEAMSYRLPIIACNISSVPELVKDGENGLLVPPADSEALASAISKLIAYPTLRKEMGENGHQMVCRKFSWEETGNKFYQVIKGLNEELF